MIQVPDVDLQYSISNETYFEMFSYSLIINEYELTSIIVNAILENKWS